MTVYSLTFDLIGIFGGGTPQLSIAYGDQDLGVEYAYASTTAVNLTIDTGSMGFDSTLLRFTFLENTGEVKDAIQLTNLKIDGNDLVLNNFTTDRGGYFHDGLLHLSQGGYTEYDASGEITDTMLNPPSGPTTPLATITGTAGDDNRLYGTDDAGDVIDALGGNDYVVAFGGDDTVNAGAGNDYVKGQAGVDTLNGDAGDDRLYGGDGNDIVNGGADNDRVYGNAGNDVVSGDGGNDRVYGNDGDDDLYGGTGNDQLSGGEGNDDLFGEDGDDHLFGGNGNDILRGGNNNDRLRGNAGNDELHGDAGDDDLNGQDGDDDLYGGTGSDTLNGEDGADVLNGDDDNDYLIGGQGADILNGGDGNDVLYGGGMSVVDQYTIRNSSAFGLSGVSYNEETQSFYRFVTSGDNWRDAKIAAESTQLNGVDGHLVTVTSQTELDYLLSRTGTDSYWVDGGDYTNEGVWRWYAGPDSDAVHYLEVGSTGTNNYIDVFATGQPNNGSAENYAYLYSQDGGIADAGINGFAHSVGYIIEWDAEDVMADNAANTLNGGAGDDTLYGGSGIDTLNGGADDDRLYGNAGNDILNGDGGADFIMGNSGNDTLDGGAGNDVLYGGDQVDIQFLAAGDVKAYGAGQDGGGTTNLLDDGIGVEFDGNAWKYLEVNYNVTANTVVEFEFRSSLEAEISGIGFDNDLNIDSNATFKVYGTQTWGRSNYDNYDGSGDWIHYEIDVGNFYTGEFRYFFLVNDDDGGGVDGNGWFRNIMIHEGDNGNNTLSGGAGVDDLYGGGGTDTFVFDAITADVDIVHNFEIDDDILDLSSIITGFTGDITDHVEIVDSGDHAILRVDADGAGGYSDVAEIWGGEGLDVATLYANGQITV